MCLLRDDRRRRRGVRVGHKVVRALGGLEACRGSDGDELVGRSGGLEEGRRGRSELLRVRLLLVDLARLLVRLLLLLLLERCAELGDGVVEHWDGDGRRGRVLGLLREGRAG